MKNRDVLVIFDFHFFVQEHEFNISISILWSNVWIVYKSALNAFYQRVIWLEAFFERISNIFCAFLDRICHLSANSNEQII